jgi:hypothetical protein
MKPQIGAFRFGQITVQGHVYSDDILIRLDGEIGKRPKHLSKSLYGTSHLLSLPEAQAVYEDGAAMLIFGGGMFGRCRLSDEAAAFFADRNCQVKLMPTMQAIKVWNELESPAIGLFHISC